MIHFFVEKCTARSKTSRKYSIICGTRYVYNIKPRKMPFGTYDYFSCTSYVWSTSGNPLFSCLWDLDSLSLQFLVLKIKPSIFNPILKLIKSHNSHTMRSSHEISHILRNVKFNCRLHNSPPFSANRTKIKPVRAFPFYCFRIDCNASHTSAPRFSKWPFSSRINLPNDRLRLPLHPYMLHDRPIIFCRIASPGWYLMREV